MRRKTLVRLALCVLAAGRAAGQSSNPGPDLLSLSLEELMKIPVRAASLHPQDQEDVPASVTIITAADIRTFGYRTLAEALSSTRGFYTTWNRSYTTVGVRGFNLPGDYASRFLVLVNGHQMTDNIFNFQLLFGDDFPIDLTLIKHIEVIRGPSSALYGTNAILATVNIVTKLPGEAGPHRFIASLGNFGVKKAQLMTSVPLGSHAQALFSGTIFNNAGQSPLFFSEFDAPETNQGQAIRMDNHKGYRFFSNLTWHGWNVTALLSEREKIQPVSWGPTVFNDRGTRLHDSRHYVDAEYSRELGRGILRWRTYFDSFHELATFRFPLDPAGFGAAVEDLRQPILGDWIGTKVSYRFDVARLGTLTAGAEARFDLQALQRTESVFPAPFEFMHVDRRDRSLALFAQNERRLSAHWTMAVGARLDLSSYRSSFLSPRAAFIYKPSPKWRYKFLYGRAFRNPSAFELFFDDGLTGAPNPAARAEKADTVEVEAHRNMGERLHLTGVAYTYSLRGFLVGAYNPDGLIHYRNSGRITAGGAGIEAASRAFPWLDAVASYAFQRTSYDRLAGLIANSPAHLGKLRFAVPVGPRLAAGTAMYYQSSRMTLSRSAVSPVYLADFTLTSRRLFPNFDVQFGLRNAFNRRYFDPIALNPQVDSMLQPGRAFFVEFIARAAR